MDDFPWKVYRWNSDLKQYFLPQAELSVKVSLNVWSLLQCRKTFSKLLIFRSRVISWRLWTLFISHSILWTDQHMTRNVQENTAPISDTTYFKATYSRRMQPIYRHLWDGTWKQVSEYPVLGHTGQCNSCANTQICWSPSMSLKGTRMCCFLQIVSIVHNTF
jgi:hypothetical protein